MDQPDVLAVKLNTRDRKGWGSQPRARPNAQFYHLQRDRPASVAALARPAPARDTLNHSVPSLAKGCAASAPVPCGAALARRPSFAPALAPEAAPQAGGTQAEEGTLRCGRRWHRNGFLCISNHIRWI